MFVAFDAPKPVSADRHSCPSSAQVVLDVDGTSGTGPPIVTEEDQVGSQSLHGAEIEVHLCSGLQYVSTLNTSHFVPEINGPGWGAVFRPGITWSSVTRDSNTKATLVVNYDGVDFDYDQRLDVTVKAAALSNSSTDRSSGRNDIRVAATMDAPGKVGEVFAEVVYPEPDQKARILVIFPQLTDYVESYSIDLRHDPPGDPMQWGPWQRALSVTTNRCEYDYVNGEWVRNPDRRVRCTSPVTRQGVWPFGPGEYEVRVIAIGATPHGQNIGPPSDPVRMIGVELEPGQPTNVRATPSGTANNPGFNAQWNHAARADRYKIQWTFGDNFDSPFEQEVDSDVHGVVVENQRAGTLHRLRIIAVSQFGREGPPSDVVEFTTLGTAPDTDPNPPPDPNPRSAIVDQYDANGDDIIDWDEVLAAVRAFYAGAINYEELQEVLDVYDSQ